MKKIILLLTFLILFGLGITLHAQQDPLSIAVTGLNQSETFNSEQVTTVDTNRLTNLIRRTGEMSSRHASKIDDARAKESSAQNNLMESFLGLTIANRRFL